MLFILLLVVLCMGMSAAAFLSTRSRSRGDVANRQIADLRERVDQLEQSALSVTNELRRLEDSQRFTERLMSGRSPMPPGPVTPEGQ